MQNIGSIDISRVSVCTHLLRQDLDQFQVAVVSREMQCCELFIGLLVGPLFEDLASLMNFNVVFETVLKDSLKAGGMIFKCAKCKRGVHAGFDHKNDVCCGATFLKVPLQFLEIVV